MSLILNIDTSTESATLCLAREGVSISTSQNSNQKDHAAWIHPAIEHLLRDASCSVSELKAIAVTAGPGSYTGLRVAMATAKGLCFALDIPLITVNTLRVMALATKQSIQDKAIPQHTLFSPMIDARRMEVFTALFNWDLDEVIQSSAIVLHTELFAEQLLHNQVIFSGSGSQKFRQLSLHPNANFSNVTFSATQLAVLANEKFTNGEFADVAYSEPLYLKEFYTAAKK